MFEFESFWYHLKVILIPPNKGDITVKCNMSTYTNLKEAPTIAEIEMNDENLITKPEETPSVMEKSIEEEYVSENDVTSPLDKFIGYAVDVTGSVYMLIFVIFILIAWVIWGGLTGASDIWQIAMQDGQSIQTYVWDTFLMRQQLDDNEKFLILSGKLKSRLESHKRLIKRLQIEHSDKCEMTPRLQIIVTNLDKFERKLLEQIDKETWFDRISEICSKGLGNLYSVVIYWVGIFVWIGCGAIPNNNGTKDHPDMEKWSNNWQMYINTAVAIELLFTSVFLEHVRARSNDVIMKKVEIFNEMDIELEKLERFVSSDYEENEVIVVKRCPRNSIQRIISFYANVIGNGLGLIISTCVFIAWFAIGDLMSWSANWWLVIGTYTGLIGFIDGFVLREVFFSLTKHEHNEFYTLFGESQDMIDMINLPITLQRYKPKITFDVKVSLWINDICSSQWSVVASVVVVIALIIMVCAMLWSETAQLICNTPTMIIEGFFLLILIQAHNWADDERSNMVGELTKSRMYLLNYVEACFGSGPDAKASGSKSEEAH